jgi:hypothetical protein
LAGEWTDKQVDDIRAILLWLGLCYKGNDEKLFIPALIPKRGIPMAPWRLQDKAEYRGNQWVMGFSVRHKEAEVALAPISPWHRFQVDVAQSLWLPDSDFVADKYFMTFVKDYMNVMIEVDADVDKSTFEEISIFVKPSFNRDVLAAAQRRQCQVDLADAYVERLLELWSLHCPGVQYATKVVWPWPAAGSRPRDLVDRNRDVEEVKQWVEKHGMGRKMQWLVGSESIIEEQLLSTKDKKLFLSSKSSEIQCHALQVRVCFLWRVCIKAFCGYLFMQSIC